jgi:hypothetical protein
MLWVWTSRTCTTPPNVCQLALLLPVAPLIQKTTAKKEESPEQALKEFAAIVEQDEPMSDWYTILIYP